MNKSVFESVTAQHAKTLNQAVNTVTDNGIGKFGIQPKQLLELGILKPGVIDIANTSISQINQALKDPSMFTGLDNINSLDDILNSETIQSGLVEKGMESANSIMKQAGVLTGGESIADTATMLGASMIGTGSDIVAAVQGEGGSLLDAAMLNVGKASQFATSLAEGPGKEVLDGITAGVSSAKGITNAVNNVNLDSINKAADSLISNTKIPSVSSISNAVKKAIDPTSVIDQVTDTVADATDFVQDALSGKIDIPNLGDIANIPGQLTGGLDKFISGGGIGGGIKSKLVDTAIGNIIPPGIKKITRYI